MNRLPPDCPPEKAGLGISALFRDEAGILCNDTALEDLNLSSRAFNGLKRAGYEFASQLIDVREDQFFEIKNIGIKSVNEIMAKIKALTFTEATKNRSPIKENALCKDFALKISDLLSVHGGKLYQELLPIFESAEKVGNTVDNRELFMAAYLRDAVKDKILLFLSDLDFGAYMADIMKIFPESIIEGKTMEHIIDEMKSEGKIIVGKLGDRIEVRRISALEYAQNTAKEKDNKRSKHIEMLLKRLQGLTLEEIGNNYAITRERVRQVIDKVPRYMRSVVVLAEDKYIAIFKKYELYKKDFIVAFGEDETVYNYLNLTCEKSENQPLEKLAEDESFPIEVRKGAEKAIAARIAKNYVIIGGKRVAKDSIALADYVVRTYAQDEISFDDFLCYYTTMLDEIGLLNDAKFIINERTYENKLNKRDNVLWKFGRKFRYYDMESRDFADLLRELALEQYNDVEYSSLKFYRDYGELMGQYDIRDEYELHNLLKKLYRRKENKDLAFIFKRMPMIEFGKANRNAQVLDMLVELAPVTPQDFAEAYEMEYGVHSTTVLGGFFKNLDMYLDDGVYDISTDIPSLSEAQFAQMSNILTADYYEISDIKRIFLREFPGESLQAIHSRTLRTLGFRIFTSYVVKNTYASAAEYFISLLTAEEIVDTRLFPDGINKLVSYTTILYDLKNRYEIIEFEPFCYINIRRLNNIGVYFDDIHAYCECVAQHIDFGEYFTVASLRNSGFEHTLDDLGFGDVFYASLLTGDNRFYCQRMGSGNIKVFRKGTPGVSLKGFLEYIIAKEVSIDIYDFVNLLIDKYGINIDKYKIISAVKNTSMYYDIITKKVYIDYDTYLEED